MNYDDIIQPLELPTRDDLLKQLEELQKQPDKLAEGYLFILKGLWRLNDADVQSQMSELIVRSGLPVAETLLRIAGK